MAAAKLAANRSPYYVKQLRSYLSLFARSLPGVRVGEVTAANLAAWLASRAHSPLSKRTGIFALRALFTFARKNRWRENDPTGELELPSVDLKPPPILTVPQARQIMQQAPVELRGYLVLCLFCGLRPSETHRIQWGDVDIERGVVTVRISKVRRWRMVPIPANAAAWLRPTAKPEGLVAPALPKVTRWRGTVPAWFGRRLKQDELRHTAASYLLAREQDAGKVATWLGNSPAVLLTHYRELVSKEAAAEFFNILPPPC